MGKELVEPHGVGTRAVVEPREQAERLSRGLAQAARRLRFSTTGRATVPGSYSARRETRILRVFRLASFLILVLVPSLTAVLYFGLIAADQYEAEAKFAVRTGALAGLDPIASMTGIPSIQVIQDTQVVTDYIRSRALVETLLTKVDLRAKYASDAADFYARLNPDLPIERIVKYWDKMHAASIEMPGGIVALTVRAFAREDAVTIANAVVAASEALVNNMNDRARQDAVSNADKRFARSGANLALARSALEVARNAVGVLDGPAQAKKAFEVIGTLRSHQLELQQQMDAAQRSTSRDAPQLRSIQFQIDAAEKQIAQLQAELTSTVATPGAAPTLSTSMTRLATLELERQVAESDYTDAAARLERARATGAVQQIYLTSFVKPVLPEEARYPKRVLVIVGTLALSLLAWTIVLGLFTFVRNKA